MKQVLTIIVCALALTVIGSAANAAGNGTATKESGTQARQQDTDFASAQARRSYALGMYLGNSVSGMPVELDVDALVQGVRDTLGGKETKLSKQKMQIALRDLYQQIKRAEIKTAKSNLQASKAFLDKNKSRSGVKVTDSGLQYKVLQTGDGAQPDLNDVVTVNYTGKLVDGTVFDSSSQHGGAATFPVNGVIKGWTEALQLMHEGAKYELYIPPKLAYGMRGAGDKIGPNQALVFDVELLKVKKVPGDGQGDDATSSKAGSK